MSKEQRAKSKEQRAKSKEHLPYRSPIRRPGGKFRQAPMIVELIGKAPHVCYVEPFCGAAHVFFAKPPSKIEVLNDTDGELMNFFRCAQTVPEAVARAVAALPHSRRLYHLMQDVKVEALDPIHRAARFCWFTHCSYAGIQTRGFHCSKSSPGGLMVRDSILSKIKNATVRLGGRVVLEQLDFRACIEKYDTPTTLFFVDPPYFGVDAGYDTNFGETEHRALADLLRHVRAKWVLTIGDSSFERGLYKGYEMRRILTASRLSKSSGRRFGELIIRNFQKG